ncbi:MAG: ABC transporter ATP-binding protein [Christensenellales bacterium]
MADILFEHVSKVYEDDKGLFDFSISVDKGGAFGLIGPAAAGKSTVLSLLMGFLKPDSGTLRIRGLTPFTGRRLLARQVGFVPRQAALPRGCSGDAFIRLLSAARGDVSRKRTQELMERLDCNPLGDWRLMAPDQRRKVSLVLGLMHDPDIYLLDEPCAGLDPNSRNAVLGLIDEHRKAGKTVFLCSHVIEEAQRCCDRVGIIREGRLVTVQSAQALSHTRQKVYHITFADVAQAASFQQEWESGVELLRNRVIVAIPASPQVLLKTLAKYEVLDLVGGRQEGEESFLRYHGDDML